MKVGMILARKVEALEPKTKFKDFEVYTRTTTTGKTVLLTSPKLSASVLISFANTLNDAAFKMMAGVIRNIKPTENQSISMSDKGKVRLVIGDYEKCADLVNRFVTELCKI